jgi:hypothetical protein
MKGGITVINENKAELTIGIISIFNQLYDGSFCSCHIFPTNQSGRPS